MAAIDLADMPLPPTKKAQAMALNAAIDHVAATLRNTRAVCRKCYIHPRIVEAWLEERLQAEMRSVRRGARPLKGLDAEESALLRWLSRYG